MKMFLNHDSPVPLYHQIAEALSYQIATGRIPPGERLPSVREAAARWGVNMHTVRHAFKELSARGLVEIRGPRGTRVLDTTRGRRSADLEDFLQRMIHEGQTQHGFSPHELAGLLENWPPRHSGASDSIHIVECSETQCSDHITEIEKIWDVEVRPWCLSNGSEPPDGKIIATYFHYNEIRRRWPYRVNDIHFVAVHPDPGLPENIDVIPPAGRIRTLTVCEFDEQMARNVAADLSLLFKRGEFRIRTEVVSRADEMMKGKSRKAPVLFPPRVWDTLGMKERANILAIKITYVIQKDDLENLGAVFGWHRKR